ARVRPEDALPQTRAFGARMGDAPRSSDAASRAGGRDEADAGPMPPRRAAWPWVVAAAILGVAIARVPLARVTSGALAGTALALLIAYALVKRLPYRRSARARLDATPPPRARSRVRAPFVAHLALGAVGAGAVVAHAGARTPPNAAGALHVAFW